MRHATDQIKPVRRICVKLHNRRVQGSLLRDGSIIWSFKSLQKEGPSVTKVRLSQEATQAMMCIYAELAGGKK